MSWLARFRNLFRRDAVADEIDRELAFHLAERADDLEAEGVPPDAARREARRRFGSVALQRENTRDRDLLVSLETLVSDFRYGVRGLRRSPIFCLTAILTLAIGIGANTAVFTLLHGLLLRSLPAHAPQELARIGLVRRDNPLSFNASVPFRLVQQLRREQRSFVDISAWRIWNVTIEAPRGTLSYEVISLVSGNGFALFGLQPRLGRLLTPDDDVPGGPAHGWPVVLSHTLWRDRFGSDPGVIGSTIKIGDDVLTVVGVTHASFHGVVAGWEPAIYLPFQYITRLNGGVDAESLSPTQWTAAIGRLKPGVTFDEANAEIAVVQERLLTDAMPPVINGQPAVRTVKMAVESARAGLPSIFGRMYSAPLYIMQGLLAVVLLLCCVNVSGLMLAKLHERQHEFAVRTAMGAPRFRLVRQYLTESFVIALVGAALGAAAAWYGSGLLLPYFRDPNMLVGLSIQPDRTVFLISAALAVGTTLAFGLVPAWNAGRTNPGRLLKSRTAAQRQLAGRGFVAIQVALSLVLVVLATLLSQSLLKLRGEDTGFDVDHVTIQTPPFHLLPQKEDAKLELYQRMVDRIAEGPGVRGAAVTWYTPMTGLQSTARFEPQGAAPSRAEGITLAYNSVGRGYFQTMGTRILAGREFERQERRRDVCVVNQSAAEVLFPGQSAVGQYVLSAEPLRIPRAGAPGGMAVPIACRVVGVAEDAKFASLREPPPRTVYFPISNDIVAGNLVFLMNATSKAAAMAAYRDALQEITPTTPLVLFATLREQMDAHLGGQRAITFLSTFFGGVALLLSAIGLYGMLSSSVTQRTGEIGIRAALGASRGAIVTMIVSDALRLVAIGVVVGAIALIFSVRSIESMLYGVGAFDLMTFVAAGVLLLVVVLLATAWPARRAASIDPLEAMRVD